MYLIPLYTVEPELAAQETRVMTLLVSQDKLRPGSYGLIEFYCPDPACHCRRVMLNVVEEKSSDRILAAIGYGFDREGKDAGPFLDPLNPQSQYADELLRLVQSAVLSDPHYVARLERHYNLVKQAASDPSHPAYRRLQKCWRTMSTCLHRHGQRASRAGTCGSFEPGAGGARNEQAPATAMRALSEPGGDMQPPTSPDELSYLIDPDDGFLCLGLRWRPKSSDPNPQKPGEKLSG